MSIPGGPTNFTTPALPTAFVPPYNATYTPLTQIVPGGIALSDPSQGRLYQDWEVNYDGANINVKPVSGSVAFSLTVANVLTVTLAFDNNMSQVIGYQTSAGSFIYYFDTLATAFITKQYAGTTSCRLCVDNAEDYYNADSDVIFGYTLSGNLEYRQQRDRYDISYPVGPATGKLKRMGPSLGNRLQFELQ